MKSDIITIAMGELQVAFDNEVMKAVRQVGIDVDKEELLKALELHHNLVRCKECKHWHKKDDLTYCDRIDYGYGYKADDFCSYGCRDSEKPNKSERSSE